MTQHIRYLYYRFFGCYSSNLCRESAGFTVLRRGFDACWGDLNPRFSCEVERL